ncbi:unnamed protein product [Mytilus edulis]|uniref:Uncharacterized protein n=1 Tax=Mytilus edulis TaxID=6550 RepID=A0A8S3TSA4_MYTED|nr:unnamed protein product [Mytilus edulis]
MAITDDNKLLLCNRTSHDVLVYNEMNQYITSVKMSPRPWDITVIPNKSTAVVTFGNKNIQFIDVIKLSPGKEITVTTDNTNLTGITSTSDNIMVGGTAHIYILNIEGKKLSVIRCQSQHISYIYYNETRKLFYCANSKIHMVFSKMGQKLLHSVSKTKSSIEA